jgi:hypothetical protein
VSEVTILFRIGEGGRPREMTGSANGKERGVQEEPFPSLNEGDTLPPA